MGLINYRGMVVFLVIVTQSLFGCKGTLSLSSNPGGDAGSDLRGAQPESDMFVNRPTDPCSGCIESKTGMKTSQPFDIQNNENEFVDLDAEGALIINKNNSMDNKYLWVADTDLPGVVKIDLESLNIVGRYRTGGGSSSRTTVNVLGEAFIGAREAGNGGSGVTKILPYGLDCPDTNGDGVVTTSIGPDDVLPWGQDDCVAWHTETAGDIRGLAAQDIAGIQHDDVCANFTPGEFDPKAVEVEDQHYLWIGGMHGKIYKLDARTGQILMTITAPGGVYGMALSGDGKLWTARVPLAFVDTTKCTDQAACEAAPVCQQTCTETDCSAQCDDAIKGVYNGLPAGYGITVDFKQRVWLSGWPDPITIRFDPHAPVNQRLAFGPPTAGGGIAADAKGWIWGAHVHSHLVRINGDTLEGVNIPAPSKGVAVDSRGRIFGVDYKGQVHLIEPGATLEAYQLSAGRIPLKGVAYAYSDMTGVQTRLASAEPGWYRHTFTGCPKGDTKWRFLNWDIEVPAGTWVIFNIRTADTAEGLQSAQWFTLTCISPDSFLDQALLNGFLGKMLEVEVRFIATGDANAPQTARIKTFSAQHMCESIE